MELLPSSGPRRGLVVRVRVGQVLTTGTELSTIRAPTPAEDAMQKVGAGLDLDAPIDSARAEMMVEAMAEVRARARQYLREPGDDAWYELVQALARTHGDSDAYDLLRAVEIHTRVARRW